MLTQAEKPTSPKAILRILAKDLPIGAVCVPDPDGFFHLSRWVCTKHTDSEVLFKARGEDGQIRIDFAGCRARPSEIMYFRPVDNLSLDIPYLTTEELRELW